MEIIIAILLGIISVLLIISVNEQIKTRSLLERVWHGLFNTPHSGLSMLSYLEYIHSKIENMMKKEDGK